MEVVLATGNVGKLKEMKALLAPFGWRIYPQTDFFDEGVEETGLTFVENAMLKARFAAAKTGLPAIADDSGLEVDILQGNPGIYSSRYAGASATDAQNVQKLLQALEGVPMEKRTANFYCAMVFLRHAEDPTPLIGLGQWQGRILTAPQGEGGFGYDPVFEVLELGISAAELPAEQKQQLSHRTQAMENLLAQMVEARDQVRITTEAAR